MKIYKIAFPGNQSKKFISSDSEFFTESEYIFGLGKISIGKIGSSEFSLDISMNSFIDDQDTIIGHTVLLSVISRSKGKNGIKRGKQFQLESIKMAGYSNKAENK